jgi:transposase-like protein
MEFMYKLNQIPTESQIRKHIRRIVFGKNLFCPECRCRNIVKYENRYRCKRCRLKFSLLSHTWLSNIKISLQLFWLVLWCWTTQVPVRQTVSITGLSELTIRHWFKSFRDNLPESDTVLEKLIQLDEAYFGGRKGQTLFLGKQVGSRNLAFEILPHANPCREHAWFFMQSHVKPESDVNTDGSSIYNRIDKWWPVKHHKEIHKKFEFEKTSEIEGMFGVLRTFIRRMYHHVTGDKLHDLVREFCYRFSHPEMFENPRYYLEFSLKLVPTP